MVMLFYKMDRRTERLNANFGNPTIFVSGENVDAAATSVDKLETTSDHKCCSFSQCFPLLICLLIVGILLPNIQSIISANSEKNNQMTLENKQMKTLINHLKWIDNKTNPENENLKMNIKDLTEQLRKLNRSTSVLQHGNKNLKAEKEKFAEKIQDLEAEKKKLSGHIQHMQTEWMKFNTSRAQWSINAYCRQQQSPRTCKPCERGWLHSQSSCYAVNDQPPAGQRSWTEAREDCRGKGSDLVVVSDNTEKNIISGYSWESSGLKGYWIGLRAEGGKWKWVDGSDLINTSWMTARPTDGQCVISVQDEGWKSVRCDEKQQWICGKAALSV